MTIIFLSKVETPTGAVEVVDSGNIEGSLLLVVLCRTEGAGPRHKGDIYLKEINLEGS